MASDHNIPLLLVSSDTYKIAKQIDNMEPLLTKDNPEKVDLLGQLIAGHVNVEEIMEI